MVNNTDRDTVKERKTGPVSQLVARVEELERLTKELKNDYLRALADFDNYRRRNERDLEIKRRERLEALLSDVIGVLDNFERALGAETDSVDAFKRGVELIYRQLCDVLVGYGLKPYSCLGEEFDPRRAEAVGFVECGEESANRVVEEVSRGYECSGKVLRPARVKVGRMVCKEELSSGEGVKEIDTAQEESNR